MNRATLTNYAPQAQTIELGLDKATMNRTQLKNYAPQARRNFIQAMTDRAAFYGLTDNKIEPVVERGDVAVIAGREHPRAVAKKRKQLEDRITRHGFSQTMEALAYTWFNRLVAIRFMELHGYLDHGYRVLSHPEGKPTPEILEHAEHVELPGLKKEAVIDLKLAGNKESELYRLLLTAQCNALHTAMPFLFERIGDETDLVLPDNLLHSDSLIRKLVSEIDEKDWKEVEIIGWLYQFYISEKKDEVIGKVVASNDIPAATQLFTPNWIVKYLVQNTLGRHWLATYPQSALRQQMQYYIEPAEQTPEVQEQLKAITPTSLNPEELTLLDPACGSGHILVEAYNLFKAIYQERGYRAKEIPALILQKNLFGLEIDDRAAQLAAFALMMKARADDRHIFDSEAKPNILAFEDSQGMNPADITHALNSPINKDDVPRENLFEEIDEEKAGLFSKKAMAEKGHVSQGDIASLLELFEEAKTFGSLLQIPQKLVAKLPEIEKRLNDVLNYGGDLMHASTHVLNPLLLQARMLARQYDAVVANPPYMGSRFHCAALRKFVQEEYTDAQADLFACFITRGRIYTQPRGGFGLITRHGWMFLSSYEEFRRDFLTHNTLISMAHVGAGAFSEISGEVVQAAAFVASPVPVGSLRPTFFRLTDGVESEKQDDLLQRNHRHASVAIDDFYVLPGAPLAYWTSPRVFDAYKKNTPLGQWVPVKEGMNTGDNSRFHREWFEVNYSRIGVGFSDSDSAAASGKRWFPTNKGGPFRKWYGNNSVVVNWQNDGLEIRQHPGSAVRNASFYFHTGITWSCITTSISARMFGHGFIFNSAGRSLFPQRNQFAVLALINSPTGETFLKVTSTIQFSVGDVAALPFDPVVHSALNNQVRPNVERLIELYRQDWDEMETSWDFAKHAILGIATTATTDRTVRSSMTDYLDHANWRRLEASKLETEVNMKVSESFGLDGETDDVILPELTSLRNEPEGEPIRSLLSYAVGCMIGRYSLDKPGLIYAHSANQGFDASQYKTFRADDDGIIPLLETDWGIRDDTAYRIVEFIGVAWPKEHLEENLRFIAECLGTTNNEQPRETIRRYLANGFYKHHLSMYKKRPIYWLFSSGKQRAFQCLVYLHRYTEGTLARMRTEYVIPLQGQIAARIEQLEADKTKATSTSHRKKLQKEQDGLKKRQAELLPFEEKLKHAADQKISLDLDDGVKVNYGKFGDLLAEAKAITGGKDDE